MGRPPSKIHDPKGYDEWYTARAVGNLFFFGVIVLLLLKGCG